MLSLVPSFEQRSSWRYVRAGRGLLARRRLRAQVVPGSSSGHLLMCCGRCDGVRRGRGIKFVAHCKPRPVQPATSGSGRNAECSGDLGRSQSFPGDEQQHLALFIRQTLRGLFADRLAAPQHRDGHRRPPTDLSEPTTEAPEHARRRASEHEGHCPRCHTATARVRRGARRSYLSRRKPAARPRQRDRRQPAARPGAPGRHGRPDRNGDTTRRTFRCWSERRYRRRWYRHLASVSRSDAHASLPSPLFVAGALERSGTQDRRELPHPRMNATVDRERSAKQTPGSIRSWFGGVLRMPQGTWHESRDIQV